MNNRDDELVRRLRAADPMRSRGQRDPATTSPRWLDDLVEATMSTPTETQTTLAEGPARRPRWPVAVAAAAVLAAVVGGSLTWGGGTDSPPEATKPALVLTQAGEDGVIASCLPFSADILAGMPTAFDARAVEVGEGEAVLEVGRWYAGGPGERVLVRTPDASSAALTGSVEFVQGERYLVTATDGTVNSCGFTMPWTEKDAAVFEQAFGD